LAAAAAETSAVRACHWQFGKVDVGHNVLSRYGPKPTISGWHGGPSITIFTRSADIRKPTKATPIDITNDKDERVHPEDWRIHTDCIVRRRVAIRRPLGYSPTSRLTTARVASPTQWSNARVSSPQDWLNAKARDAKARNATARDATALANGTMEGVRARPWFLY